MANRPFGCFLRQLNRSASVQQAAALTDGQLLERFLAGQDGDAFDVLVQRHGSLVWGVCRRVAYEREDAEDAFQATFLVLLRKAKAMASRSTLASWLYGVAYRVALNANTATARRRRRERQVVKVAETQTSAADWHELRPVLDSELNRLPEVYRSALLLCYLEGKTNEQAARELGWATGSISKRLARGRELLRERLAARGVTLSALALGGLLAENAAHAAPPAALIDLTAEAARAVAAGQTSGLAAAHVSQLTEGVLRTMMLAKLKVMALSAAACVAAAFGISVLSAQQAAPPPPAVEAKADPAKVRPAKLDLTPETFANLHALVRPQPSEWRHLKVDWLTDVASARKKAAAEDKPIIICYTGGAGYNEPLGVC